MKKIFNINEEEKSRILNLHESATKKHYLNEQTEPVKVTETEWANRYPCVQQLGQNYRKVDGYTNPTTKGVETYYAGDANHIPGKSGLRISYFFSGKYIIMNPDKTINENGTFACNSNRGGDIKLTKSAEKPKADKTPAPSPAPVDTKKPNDKVKELQIKLNSLPNVVSVIGSKLTEDGLFGSKTLEAALIALRGSSPESVKSIRPTNVPTGQTQPDTLSPRTEPVNLA
jgi:hypothetical protein